MNIIVAEVIGYVGAVLCVLSFVFQMYKAYLNRSLVDMSWKFIILQLAVNVLYTTYNIMKFNMPLLMGCLLAKPKLYKIV